MRVYHFDVKRAFLYSKFDAEASMGQLSCFGEHPQANEVCNLLKGLYKINQGNKLWGNRLSANLIGGGFSHGFSHVRSSFFLQMPTCACLYFHRERKAMLIVYVEDWLVCAKIAEGKSFKLRHCVSCTDHRL